MSVWDNRELLEKLEKKRDSLRYEGKLLTFDCLKLLCLGDRAVCSKGHRLGQARDGSLSLLAVLKGITSTVCKDCGDFVTEK